MECVYLSSSQKAMADTTTTKKDFINKKKHIFLFVFISEPRDIIIYETKFILCIIGVCVYIARHPR